MPELPDVILYVLKTNLAELPCGENYLTPADREVDLGPPHVPGARLRVGITWCGSPTHVNDAYRSMTIDQFLPLFQVPNVAFYSLQIGPRADDLQELGDDSLSGLRMSSRESFSRWRCQSWQDRFSRKAPIPALLECKRVIRGSESSLGCSARWCQGITIYLEFAATGMFVAADKISPLDRAGLEAIRSRN